MDRDFALKLAAEIGIDVQQVIREEVELTILNGLFDSPISDKLIFKGGTALRLLYESPRFSEDLDFSLTGKIDPAEFKKIITSIVASDTRFSIRDLMSKYYTHLAEIRIKESWQDTALSIKIEISKRAGEKDIRSINALARSPSTNLTVMTRASTLEAILKDKLRAIKERKMCRDIFDIWFIYQKTGKPFDLKNFGYPKGEIRQGLRKFLPKKFYPIVEDLERSNAQDL